MGLFMIMLFLFVSTLLSCYGDDAFNSSSILWSMNYDYTSTFVKPFGWSYLRVELPPRFESLTIALYTDVELDPKSVTKRGAENLPIMCFREGGPPLPDVSNSEGPLKDLVKVYNPQSKGVQTVENCYFLQGNMTFTLTNEEVTEGVLYMGLFYGIGPARTQSKMINRGKPYTFNALASVDSCSEETSWGKFCNKTLEELKCVTVGNNVEQQTTFSCKNVVQSCHQPDMTPKLFYFSMKNVSEELKLSAEGIGNTRNDQLTLMCYSRNGAIPTENLFHYSTDISKNPLVIQQPKLGTWYFYIVPRMQNGETGGSSEVKQVCYSLGFEVNGCTERMAGPNCLWRIFDTEADEDNIISTNEKGNLDYRWTYYTMDIPPPDTSSRNIRVELESNVIKDYEFYARFNGLPSLDEWDYYYANQSRNSNNGSSLFKLYESSNQRLRFDIIYAREGNWSFGLRQRSSVLNDSQFISISLEPCPSGCSGFGTCSINSGSTSGSFCQCDRFHGGFDCSVELVSKGGQKLWILLLVGSNAAAIVPAVCALWKKTGYTRPAPYVAIDGSHLDIVVVVGQSYAEWVVYLSSGLASALYHACDSQWTCVSKFSTLQFMDFWLSFVAVASTFVYMTFVSEAMKRAILSVVWIITALLATGDATSSRNITYVIIIGVVCLLVASLVDSLTKYKSFATIICRLNKQKFNSWLRNLLKKLYRRFRWTFVVAGFVALALAATSWNLENYANYWIWHSIWHIAMYTAAAFFICSKNIVEVNQSQPNMNGDFQMVTTA